LVSFDKFADISIQIWGGNDSSVEFLNFVVVSAKALFLIGRFVLEKRPFFVGLFLKKRPGKLGSLQPRRIIVLAGNVGHDSFICAT